MNNKRLSVILLLLVSIIAEGQTILHTELLGRPTNNSIHVTMMFSDSVEIMAQYGSAPGNYSGQTAWRQYGPEESADVLINNLTAGNRYYYRLRYRKPGGAVVINRPEYHFQTQRPKGSRYVFSVQADPHLDEQSDSSIYNRCLQNQLEDDPDFVIDLGDFIMTDKLKNKTTNKIPRDTVTFRCHLLRSFYSKLCHSVPLYNVLGNHEAESGWNLNGTANNIAVWNTIDRKKFFPTPYSDGFYSGDTSNYNFTGQRAAYYSWTWGDALFIVIDPYWFTAQKPDSLHGWRWTLGKKQYDWLKTVLETSDAKFKFLFAHQLVGGDPNGRGGVEYADLFEWGGKSLNGVDSFAIQRPGWYKPIKDLLKENKVNIFFHGHDHFYGKQEKDCLIYQECPQPSHPNPSGTDNVPYAAGYGYREGIIQASSGHLRVTVDSAGVKVEYVRTYTPAEEDNQHQNKDVSATYFIGSSNCYDSTSIDTNQQISPVLWNTDYVHELVYPNPTATICNIEFELLNPGPVHLNIFNASGQLIRRLLQGQNIAAGKYRVVWDGRTDAGQTLPKGLYLYSLQFNGKRQNAGKIILN